MNVKVEFFEFIKIILIVGIFCLILTETDSISRLIALFILLIVILIIIVIEIKDGKKLKNENRILKLSNGTEDKKRRDWETKK